MGYLQIHLKGGLRALPGTEHGNIIMFFECYGPNSGKLISFEASIVTMVTDVHITTQMLLFFSQEDVASAIPKKKRQKTKRSRTWISSMVFY